MKKWKILLFLTIFINLSQQTPLKTDEQLIESKPRAEEKNWKVKTQVYNDKIFNNKIFDDSTETYRLPNDTLPIRYDIHLTTDVHVPNFDFNGRVKIHIRAVEETSVVTLQYRDITISKVSLLNLTSDEVLVDDLPFEYIQQYEFIKITVPNLLQVNDEIRLEIIYNGTLQSSDAGAGFYRASYTENGETVYYGVTQFESTDARHAFPCYDEPAIRAPIGLSIQHDKSYNAHSNMLLIDTIPVAGTDYVISKFDDTPPMQTYLLAFIVSPFDSISNNDIELPQSILAKRSSILDGSADFAMSIADPIMKKLVNHFNVNYTLPKLDHAAITQFAAGAMENWGLVTYRERYLLFTPTSNPTQDESNKRSIIATMAHEDAHQFFGNLVAPHWWSDLWMNEGFATLYEYYIPHLVYPNDGWMEEFRVYEINYSFSYDVLSAQRTPMHYYVENPIDIDRRFNSISYTKSGVVLNMFQEALSVQTFTKGLTKYINKMAYKAATPNDLFESLQEAYNEDYPTNEVEIPKVMSTWVYQAGYPIVEVSRNEQGFLVFKQRRFPDSAGEVYAIPLSFATSNQPDFEDKTARIWLYENETSINQGLLSMGGEDWIILNVQQTGYYRVGYSGNLWQSIGKGLQNNFNQVHFTNRRVLQNELNLGYLTLNNILASDVLEVLRYLENENEYIIWLDAATVLRSLNTTLFGTSAYEHYLDFIKTITVKHLERIGLEAIDGEPTENRNLRNQVKTYNCYALDEDCLTHELAKLNLFKENEEENPVPDFCSAFRYAPIALYDYYLNELASNQQLSYRNRIVNSIGCSLNKQILGILAVLVESTDPSNILTTPERAIIINNMMISSTVGLEVAFEYLERNIDKISTFTTNLRIAINTEEYYEKLSNLLDEAISENFISQINANSLKNAIRVNLEWQEKHLNSVLKWFGITVNETTTTPRNDVTSTILTTTTDTAGVMFLSFFAFSFWSFIQIFINW